MFGGQTQVFCAVDGVGGQSVEYLPSSWKNVALWFGVTAFLFCVHSMVRCVCVCACACVCVCRCVVCVCVYVYMCGVCVCVRVCERYSIVYVCWAHIIESS